MPERTLPTIRQGAIAGLYVLTGATVTITGLLLFLMLPNWANDLLGGWNENPVEDWMEALCLLVILVLAGGGCVAGAHQLGQSIWKAVRR